MSAPSDFGKCENWYGIHEDQFMHFACKVVWLSIATGWAGTVGHGIRMWFQ